MKRLIVTDSFWWLYLQHKAKYIFHLLLLLWFEINVLKLRNDPGFWNNLLKHLIWPCNGSTISYIHKKVKNNLTQEKEQWKTKEM